MAPRSPAVAALVLCCVGAVWRPCCGGATVVSGELESLDEFGSFGVRQARAPPECKVPEPVAPPEEFDFLRSPLVLFLGCLGLLALGYIVFGGYMESMLQPDDTKSTPAVALEDGMDFCPMGDYRVFLIQLLNIAGLGPIFGPIQGAQFGPSALVWIVFGSIFFGSVMDYLVGMMSLRSNGASITTLVGKELGSCALALLNVVSLLLLLGVGVIFVKGPSEILGNITWGPDSESLWAGVVFIYYIVATLVPVDAIIGRLYPVFGAALVFMTLGLIVGTVASGRAVPDMVLTQADGTWPYPSIVVVISCAAISGFHATQTPMMARCITSQGSAKKIFYGAMITEGVIGLIWAISPLIYFGGQAELTYALGCAGSPATLVQTMLSNLLGSAGGAFAIVGVVALPITSGDTAFRSARLIIAEIIGTTEKQQQVYHRLLIAVPLFSIAFGLTFVDFAVMWQYFNFVNQVVSVMALWTGAVFLRRQGKNHFVASLPASILTFFLASYIFKSKEFGTAGNSILFAFVCGAILTVLVVGGMCRKLGMAVSLAAPSAIADDGTGFELSAGEKEAAVKLVRRDSMRGAARL